MDAITLVQVSAQHADLAYLIGKLDEELLQLYPGDEIFGVDVDDPEIEEAIFVIAYHNGMPVGCGGIRPVDQESTELKRFYVEPSCRNQGIAGRLLVYLEQRATALNFSSIKLETGPQQSEALQFYRKHGYCEIERFGPYTDCPSSLCFAKGL